MDILRAKRKALELIHRIKREGAFSHVLLQAEAKRRQVSEDEYPIMVSLVRGVLQEEGRLNELLDAHIRRGIDSLPDRVADVLRLGAYQIVCLERVRKKDVVFESVELLKGGRFASFRALVNAVLRKIEPVDDFEKVKAAVNYPTSLITRWVSQFGEQEVERFCAASNKRLPLYLRVNTLRCSREQLCQRLRDEQIEVIPSTWSSHSVEVVSLPRASRIHDCQAFKDGLFFIQDCSSTVVADLVELVEPDVIHDVCAAPGGKACSMALTRGSRGGQVVAFDRTTERVALIQDLVYKLGLSNVTTRVFDMLVDAPAYDELVGLVLVDAPCSGFGTVGKKVEARWNTSVEEISSIVAMQRKILERACQRVASGGAVIYSTCSIDKEENEGVVEAFLAAHPEFSIRRVNELVHESLCTKEGYLRTWPHRHHMTGAFAAVLVRS
jgi:16S rRNA (cytosine967-C5)-methyltransferase